MSFPLKELTRLLAPDTKALGSVVSTYSDSDLVRVATAKGAVMARRVEALAVGDRVQISHGIATKAPVVRAVYPV